MRVSQVTLLAADYRDKLPVDVPGKACERLLRYLRWSLLWGSQRHLALPPTPLAVPVQPPSVNAAPAVHQETREKLREIRGPLRRWCDIEADTTKSSTKKDAIPIRVMGWFFAVGCGQMA